MPASGETGITIGLLSERSLSNEQSAYRALLQRLGYTVEVVSLSQSSTDVSKYDVLCWHRDRSLDGQAISDDMRTQITDYLENGGGLFLGLFALEAVEQLDIDSQTPDTIPENEPTESGLLVRTIYSEHPAVSDFDTVRVSTQPSRDGLAGVCYQRYVPQDGSTIASRVLGGDDTPAQKSMCEWQVGDGTVLGLGTDCWTANVSAPYLSTLETLFTGVIDHLAGSKTEATGDYPTHREDFAAMRARLAADHHRPQYHISPPANWLNDPNGIIKWDDEYHVFYQYNPAGPFHDTVHWGHAVSEDLVTWRDEPIALAPEPGSPDEDGCWSGCAVDDDGTPTFIYTGNSDGDQRPCIATGDDDLRDWTVYEGNPVIQAPPEDLHIAEGRINDAEFRDHCVWQEEGTWYQIIGSGIEDVGGTALLYESDDLYDWEYCGPILSGDWPGTGTVWECPELLDLGDKSLLHVSNFIDVVYFLGEYSDGSFEPDEKGKLDYGNLYAPQSTTIDGRTLMWGWVKEDRSGEAQWDAGWSGMLSLPREIDLDADGVLQVRPADELEQLRGDHHQIRDLTLTPDSPNPLAEIQSRTAEIRLEFDAEDAWETGLAVFQTSKTESMERTVIQYVDGEIIVEREESTQVDAKHETATHEQVMPVSPRSDGTIELHCFLDGSVIEIFANDHQCLTSRVYPASEDSDAMELYTLGGETHIEQLDVWELNGGGMRRAADDTGR